MRNRAYPVFLILISVLLIFFSAGCKKETADRGQENNKIEDNNSREKNGSDNDNKDDSSSKEGNDSKDKSGKKKNEDKKRTDINPEIERIISDMTLEEKVAQMIIARCPEVNAKELAEQYKLGGYILFARDFQGKTSEQVVTEISSYQENMKVKMLIGTDEEGGTVNRVSINPNLRYEPYKSPQQLYNAGGMNLIHEDTAEKSQLLKSLGINLNFAPVADMSENPSDFIYPRTFGHDAEETSEYIKTVVGVMKQEKIGSMLKHFPGYGNNLDTHTGSAYDSRTLENFIDNDFKPFEAGISAGTDSILVSHNIIENIDSERPASLSPEIHRILREDLNFNGVIVTDDLDMEAINLYADNLDKAVLAVQAGNDLLCTSDFVNQIPAIVEAVNNGNIEQKQIDDSVRRILKMKMDLGIIEIE